MPLERKFLMLSAASVPSACHVPVIATPLMGQTGGNSVRPHLQFSAGREHVWSRAHQRNINLQSRASLRLKRAQVDYR